ncbi:MAG: tRNA lysidine(34) synthetase TilS, partial [Clostridia bacterium]|nr:tRNA lysidine(34) synthetase TilS [Clostridia bacterium]
CLLEALFRLREEFDIILSAAHLHHGLRGAAADRDADFCQSLCREKGIPFYGKKVDVKALAEEKGMSLEEAGRYARYAFFAELQREQDICRIATAHHADDNIETVLMRLIRGTGPKGLAGIPYRNGAVIRPLLDVSRKEIESFLSDIGQTFCTDESNFEEAFTRNKIRNSLLPTIEKEFNPNFRASFQEQIRLYAQNADYIQEQTEEAFARLSQETDGGYRFCCKALRNEPEFLVRNLLHLCLDGLLTKGQGTGGHIEAIYRLLQAGQGELSLPDGITAEICYDSLYLHRKLKTQSFCYELPDAGRLYIPEADVTISLSAGQKVPDKANKDRFYLNPELISGKKLFVRSRREGDFIFLTEAGGRKKLQDYFVDEKLPRFDRDSVPIVATEDEVLWIAGHRGSARYTGKKGQENSICLTIHKGDYIR